MKPESQDTKSLELLMDELERPRKRPRSVPVVLLPTLADVRRHNGQVEGIEEVEEDYKKLKLLKDVSLISNYHSFVEYERYSPKSRSTL
jgi:hypothetical protein